MNKYECHTIYNGQYQKFIREFDSFEHAYAVLESEGHKVFSLKQLT